MQEQDVLDPGHDIGAEPVERGCGTREQGGVYVECGTSAHGHPLEYFLVDPPRQFEPESAVGVDLVEGPDGKVHVFDYVGAAHYPWPADVLEEGRAYGFSRRVAKNIDLSRLSEGSRLVMLHKKGKVKNWSDLHPAWGDVALDPHCAGRQHCGQALQQPSEQIHLDKPHIECSKLHWLFPDPEDPTVDEDSLTYWRTHASTSYRVVPPTDADRDAVLDEAEFRTAIIASVPVTNVSVIEADDGSHEETVEEKKDELDQIPVTVQPF